MKSRYQTCKEPAPAGWVPKIGEEVIVPADEGTIGHLKASAKVVGIGGGCVKVKMEYGRRLLEGFFKLEDVRPIRRGK